jgi:hypothetical protein
MTIPNEMSCEEDDEAHEILPSSQFKFYENVETEEAPYFAPSRIPFSI